nr:winged helix DNA-binding domain-containing protein [Motilibacter deserti]
MLLERTTVDPPSAVDTVVGLQAQVPAVPYLALHARLEAFDPAQLAAPLEARELVRAPLLRATVHLMSARDCRALRPLLQPVLARTFAGTAWSRMLAGTDIAAVLASGRTLVAEHPLTRAELGPLLTERHPGLDPEALAMAFSYLEPLVQVTPRGSWGRSGRAALTTYDSWLGPGAVPPARAEELVLRYLRAYGPASVKDVQTWSGLTRLREVAAGLGGLRRYRSPAGAELLDVPDALLPDPDTPAPPRFMPEYDNALLGYADRSRVVGPGDHVLLQGGPGGHTGTLLVDGFVAATWAVRRDAGRATLQIRPSAPIRPQAMDAVTDEGSRLLAFVAPDEEHDIAIVP